MSRYRCGRSGARESNRVYTIQVLGWVLKAFLMLGSASALAWYLPPVALAEGLEPLIVAPGANLEDPTPRFLAAHLSRLVGGGGGEIRNAEMLDTAVLHCGLTGHCAVKGGILLPDGVQILLGRGADMRCIHGGMMV